MDILFTILLISIIINFIVINYKIKKINKKLENEINKKIELEFLKQKNEIYLNLNSIVHFIVNKLSKKFSTILKKEQINIRNNLIHPINKKEVINKRAENNNNIRSQETIE